MGELSYSLEARMQPPFDVPQGRSRVLHRVSKRAQQSPQLCGVRAACNVTSRPSPEDFNAARGRAAEPQGPST
jgi:hypothetical protein